MDTLYRVKELSTVTDDNLERVINENVSEGWSLDTIQFAMRDGSKRPAMAFVLFTKEGDEAQKCVMGEGPCD
jgi:hypothetical protein